MSVINDIIDLISTAKDTAKTIKNEELASKLIDIEYKVKDIIDENNNLKEQLNIVQTIKYDEGNQSFTINNDNSVHYCSVCYGQGHKLIPVSLGQNNMYKCRICEEVWMNKYRPQ